MGLRDSVREALSSYVRRAQGSLSAASTAWGFDATPGSTTTYSPPPVAQTEWAAPQAVGLNPRKRTKTRPRTAPLPVVQTRWNLSDIEWAVQQAAAGNLTLAAQLYRVFTRDGLMQGLLSTRTSGLLRLPRRFQGDAAAVQALDGEREGLPGLFERIFPPAELERLATDGIVLGIGVAEFVQGEQDSHPVLVRLDPEFIIYRWAEDRWYYRTLHGLEPITPGDGRWVLYQPKGRYEPWNHGLWQALARSYIAKEHSFLYRENYASKLANPARVAVSPQGASEPQKQGWWRSVMAWGVNSVFGVAPGYDVKLLESNGRGIETFQNIIDTSNNEFMVAICGQIVTVTGGAGFANANIHASIRSDIIQADGHELASCLNAQALPAVVHDLVGEGSECTVAWDTRPPADLKAGADSLTSAAKAIDALTASLKAHNLELDVSAMAARFSVPILGDENGDAVPDAKVEAPDNPAVDAAEQKDTEFDIIFPGKVLSSSNGQVHEPDTQRFCAMALEAQVVKPVQGKSTKRASFRTYAFKQGDPPKEAKLWNYGDNETDYGVHKWTDRSIQAVMASYMARGNPLSVDVEHNSADKPDPAKPAPTGGYAMLEIRNGEPWLTFDWSAYAVSQIATRQRLFLSPEYDVDKASGEITRLVRVSLVADPGTHHARMLASAKPVRAGASTMNLALILAALKAAASAEDPEAAKTQIQALVAEIEKAAGTGDGAPAKEPPGDGDGDEAAKAAPPAPAPADAAPEAAPEEPKKKAPVPPVEACTGDKVKASASKDPVVLEMAARLAALEADKAENDATQRVQAAGERIPASLRAFAKGLDKDSFETFVKGLPAVTTTKTTTKEGGVKASTVRTRGDTSGRPEGTLDTETQRHLARAFHLEAAPTESITETSDLRLKATHLATPKGRSAVKGA